MLTSNPQGVTRSVAFMAPSKEPAKPAKATKLAPEKKKPVKASPKKPLKAVSKIVPKKLQGTKVTKKATSSKFFYDSS